MSADRDFVRGVVLDYFADTAFPESRGTTIVRGVDVSEALEALVTEIVELSGPEIGERTAVILDGMRDFVLTWIAS